MKKLFLVIVMTFVYGFSAYACYENNYPITVTQPDGAVVQCFTTGDEFYRWVHDENGFTLIEDPQTGVVVYAKLENDELVSTGYRVGSVDPAAVGLTPWQIISAEKREKMRSDFLEKTPQKMTREDFQTSSRGKNDGTLNNLVIYIRFSDDEEFPAHKADIYDGFFNKDVEGQSSLYAYFKALSGEKTFIPSTFYPEGCSNEVIVSYQDIYPRSYFQIYHPVNNPNGYPENDGGERAKREQEMLIRAIDAVGDDISEDLDIDFNNNGYVDNICFIVRGTPGPWSSLLWPHKWSLFWEDTYINDKQVGEYNLLIETHLDGSKSSVIAHEMFHTLGAPDLYRYSDNTIDPVGAWDLMCSNTNPPQSTTAWMKYKYGGWIDEIPEITEFGTYTLNNIWSETNNAYKIASPNSSTEFFVIEYRDKSVYWDSGLPGSGLIIYRIDTRNGLSGNAGGPPDEVYIFRPNGTNTTTNGSIGSAHFSASTGRTVFTNVSNPPCFLSDNRPGGIAIFNIGEGRDGTISFEVNDAVLYSELFLSTSSMTFANVPVGTTSEPQTVSVYGSNLAYPITYEKSGTNSDFFTITESEWDDNGGVLSVTYTPDAAKIHVAKLTFKATGAMSQSVTLKGGGITVAIDEQDATDGITIYPNPTEGKLTIEYNNGVCPIVGNVEIFDLTGKCVAIATVETGRTPSLQQTTTLDISSLPAGIYFIRINTEEGVIKRKVIKN